MQWRQLMVAALGVWLIAAPGVLGFGEPGSTVHRIAGPVIAAVGFLAAFPITRALRWVALLPAAALVVAAWPLGITTSAAVNAGLVGLLVLVLAPAGPDEPERYGGGWRAVLDPDRLERPG